MPQIFRVDQAATFVAVAFLSSAPKTKFGTLDQDKTRDGLPKWEVQVVAAIRDGERTSNEVLKINLASPTDPGQGIGMYTPVQLVGMAIGVTPAEQVTDQRTGQTKVRGGSVWYRADAIRATSATGKS